MGELPRHPVRALGSPAMGDQDAGWRRALVDVLGASHLVTGDGIADIVDSALAPLGVRIEIFLVDHEQRALRPVRPDAAAVIRIDGTLPGRAYRLNRLLPSRDEPSRDEPSRDEHSRDEHGGRLLWVPLLNGVERYGLLRVALPSGADADDPALQEDAVRMGALIAHLISAKTVHSDTLACTRRTHPMSVASELLWQLLPPLTFGCKEMALSALLEPAYGVGGDAFDYAVDAGLLHLSLLDPAGHDLSAGLTAAVTLAAGRSARREGLDLGATAARIDATLTAEFTDYRFVTGVLARLDLSTGQLVYLNAGHPPPVLLREGRQVRPLDGGGRPPLGRVATLIPDAAAVAPAEEQLQPGDRLLLYSDGVVEAGDRDGGEFGVERLVDLAERSAAAGLPAPETLRRLSHAVQEHQDGVLRDDATLMLVEWSGRAAQRLVAHPGEQ
jgi:sigma-B regulation protein RsbU (phosphoserine phosphatase)